MTERSREDILREMLEVSERLHQRHSFKIMNEPDESTRLIYIKEQAAVKILMIDNIKKQLEGLKDGVAGRKQTNVGRTEKKNGT